MNSSKEANIRNMTALWCNYGARLEQLPDAQMYSSYSWPNRLWLNTSNNFCGQNSLRESIIQMLSMNPKHTLATWDSNLKNLEPCWAAEQHPRIKFRDSMIGMSLDIATYLNRDPIEDTTKLNVHLIDKQQVEFWCTLCSKGFEYKLDTRAIFSAIEYSNNKLYWYSIDDKPVGTALTSASEKTMGFYQIAVLPEWRGQGVASAIVSHLLGRAKLAGAHRAILQASPMGLGLYKKLGFTEDFELKNYELVV